MFFLLGGLLACTEESEAPAELPAVREEAGRFLDADGRHLLFRGVNARVEGLFDVTFADGRTALEEIPPFTGEDCAFLAGELGMNLLRLPVNWSGIEPEPDAFNEAYLDQMMGLIEDCHAVGVYTVVDLHQDAYSKEIGEDGAPLWAIVPAPTELLEGPLDDLEERRTSPQVLAAFQSLYADAEWTDGETLQDAYADVAAHLAARIDGHPGVVGLELMNEPVSFNDLRLHEFHVRVGEAVRAVDADLLLVFEPDALRNFTDADPVAHPFPFESAAYAPHVYTEIFTDGWESGDPSVIQASVAAAADEAARHDAALFVGEFGHDPKTDDGRAWLEVALDAYDTVGASWASWLYEEWSQGAWGLYDMAEGPSRGALREEAADLFARPFPVAVDGRIAGVAWDAAARALTVSLSDAGEGAHRLSAPARTWPDGVVARCDGAEVEVKPASIPGRVDVPCAGSTLVLGPA